MTSLRKTLLTTLCVLVASQTAEAQTEKRKRVGKVEEFKGYVLRARKIAGRVTKIQCGSYAIYHLYERRVLHCTDWRLGGNCLIPGYAESVGSGNCPRFCNDPRWSYGGTVKEYAGTVIRNCLDIGVAE
jgi:hypothetical protein